MNNQTSIEVIIHKSILKTTVTVYNNKTMLNRLVLNWIHYWIFEVQINVKQFVLFMIAALKSNFIEKFYWKIFF